MTVLAWQTPRAPLLAFVAVLFWPRVNQVLRGPDGRPIGWTGPRLLFDFCATQEEARHYAGQQLEERPELRAVTRLREIAAPSWHAAWERRVPGFPPGRGAVVEGIAPTAWAPAWEPPAGHWARRTGNLAQMPGADRLAALGASLRAGMSPGRQT